MIVAFNAVRGQNTHYDENVDCMATVSSMRKTWHCW
jgi:hypothetical protein